MQHPAKTIIQRNNTLRNLILAGDTLQLAWQNPRTASANLVEVGDSRVGPLPSNAKMNTPKQKKPRNPHDGASLDDFLREEGIFEEVEAAALKRALAMKVADLMRKEKMKKTAMAQRMRTSRAALDRLLDPANTSVTLATLNRAANPLDAK